MNEFILNLDEDILNEAQAQTTNRLELVESDSLNPNNTNNIYIEGDNLDALRLLQADYENKIKLIYIDPPYNTRQNSFAYNDNFKISSKESKLYQPQLHSAWLGMLYPRLMIAQKLLSDDGIICISIDEKELFNLRLLCDNIFGYNNFVNCVTVKSKIAGVSGGAFNGKCLQNSSEYILIFCKDKASLNLNYAYLRPKLADHLAEFKFRKTQFKYNRIITKLDGKELIKEDKERGMTYYGYREFETMSISDFAFKKFMPELKVYVKYADKIFYPSNAQSSIRHTTIAETKDKGYPCVSCEYIPVKGKYKDQLIEKLYAYSSLDMLTFLDEVIEKKDNEWYYLTKVTDFWDDISFANLMNEGKIKFKNGKKPIKMIKRLMEMNTDKDSIVLDFFSGSGSTAHAVMDMNAADGGNRKFILVQKTEDITDDDFNTDTEFKTIPEVGRERIRRSAEQVKQKYPNTKTDLGFRSYKIVD